MWLFIYLLVYKVFKYGNLYICWLELGIFHRCLRNQSRSLRINEPQVFQAMLSLQTTRL